MNKNDEIKGLLTSLQDAKGGYYPTKTPMNEMTLGIYLVALSPYSFAEVQLAIQKHIMTPDNGQFFPKVADIVKHLGVKQSRDYGWQDVIEGARNPKTPCDVLARIHIKSFYLDSYENLSLKHRADTFLDNIEEDKARALAGEYTQHEIVTMISHKVKVSTPFMVGMPQCADKGGLRAKYDKAIQSPLHIENVARIKSRERNGLTDLEGQKKVLNELKGLFNNEPTAKADDKNITGAEAAQILEDDLK